MPNKETLIMEEALSLLERGKLPPEVSDAMLWSGMIAIYKQTTKTNGNVSKNHIRLTRLERIVYVGGGIVTLFVGAFIKELVGLLF